MGLSGPKKRAKLSHDPNNTAWARNTESFGHKILSSQGWTPGETLGAVGAAHAEHYTAGSNSHIRVLLKEDQLGLGAKLTGNNAETFGLSLFSGILGRLNGKTEVQLEKEERKHKDVELALYQSRKLGFVNFVSAGYLVGDRLEKAEIVKKEALKDEVKDELKKAKDAAPGGVDITVRDANPFSAGTKRKRTGIQTDADKSAVSSDDSSSSSAEGDAAPAPRKTKGSKKEKSGQDSEATSVKKSSKTKRVKTAEGPDAASTKSKSKRSKKNKSADASSSEDEERAAKKLRKAERRARKEERRERKASKQKLKAAKSASASATPSTTAPSTPTVPASGSATPHSTPFLGRHAVRQRYIAAKSRAHLDPQALKEVRCTT